MLTRNHHLFLFAAASALTLAPSLSLAAPNAIKESSDFTYQYEMDVDPTTQDLDSDGNADWAAFTGTTAFASGVLTLDGRFNGTGMSIWQTSGLSAAAEWTMEIRARIRDDSEFGATGQTWGVSISNETGTVDDLVEVGPTEVHIPAQIDALVRDTFEVASPVGEFVDLRIARDADGLWAWHNDTLLNHVADPGFDHPAVVNRLMIGGYSGRLPGPFDVDHVRMTSGAFAPVPEPASVALLGMGALLALRRRR